MKPTSVSSCSIPMMLILLLGLMLVFTQPLKADAHNQSVLYHYHKFLSDAADPIPMARVFISELLTSAGSSITLESRLDRSMPLLVRTGKPEDFDQISDDPTVLVAVDLNHTENVAWSLSIWLSMIEEYLQDGGSSSIAFTILPRLGTDTSFVLEAGSAFWLVADPYQILADLNPQSVILLDIVPDPRGLLIEAETRGKLSPFHVLLALRSSLAALDLSFNENVVQALYARAGLIDGSVGLLPWLELGVPAIRLHGQLKGQFQLLPARIMEQLVDLDEPWSRSRDVNYLRYQLPAAVISLDDVSLTSGVLILLAVFMASVALRPLFTRSHAGGLGPGALPEAMVAYLFSFIAVSLSWLIHGFASRLLATEPLSVNLNYVALAIGIIGRLGSSMLFFFAVSGLSARMGLLPHTVRGTASQAAAMIAGVLGISVLFFSIQGSLILFGVMILLSLAGVNAAVAVLSISLLVVTLLPLVISAAPVFVPGLVTILNAEGRQLLLLAGFTAPVALWILTTLSPRHRLVRGDRTAPYLVAAALVFCFLDPWLRSSL